MTPETDSRGNTVWAGSPVPHEPLVSKYPPLWTMYRVEIICLVATVALVCGIFAGLWIDSTISAVRDLIAWVRS